jgi:hypothetical protein
MSPDRCFYFFPFPRRHGGRSGKGSSPNDQVHHRVIMMTLRTHRRMPQSFFLLNGTLHRSRHGTEKWLYSSPKSYHIHYLGCTCLFDWHSLCVPVTLHQFYEKKFALLNNRQFRRCLRTSLGRNSICRFSHKLSLFIITRKTRVKVNTYKWVSV